MAKDVVRQADQTCCGVIQEAQYQAREKREQRTKPQPWIVLKLVVGITIAVIVYSSYVYLGRFCVPMMLRNYGALGNQATGITFCAVFCLLLIMVLWTYAKIVLTPPGLAKEFVSKSAEPSFPRVPPSCESLESDNIGGAKYEPTNNLNRPRRSSHARANSRSRSQSLGRSTQRNAKMSQKLVVQSSTTLSSVSAPAAVHKPARTDSRRYPQGSDANVEILDSVPPAASHRRDLEIGRDPTLRSQNATGQPPPLYSRKIPTTLVLLPQYRYCYKDELLKPFRAHHCRTCGTCVLKYDHHCPWVGQCVGARNHKFFVNFVLWAAIFCIWIFATVVSLVAKEASNPYSNLDPQMVVIIALAGMFGLFTVALFVSHVHLICLNQTTVESLAFRAMREQENVTLAKMHPWYYFGAKKRTQQQWDSEWGRIGKEGNIWWLGSKRENWEAVMGRNIWWWFLPIGHSSSDGLIYPVNPRFDSEGRWRRRTEWPSDLR